MPSPFSRIIVIVIDSAGIGELEDAGDYGDEGRQAVEELLRRAEATGAYEQPVRVEFV